MSHIFGKLKKVEDMPCVLFEVWNLKKKTYPQFSSTKLRKFKTYLYLFSKNMHVPHPRS